MNFLNVYCNRIYTKQKIILFLLSYSSTQTFEKNKILLVKNVYSISPNNALFIHFYFFSLYNRTSYYFFFFLDFLFVYCCAFILFFPMFFLYFSKHFFIHLMSLYVSYFFLDFVRKYKVHSIHWKNTTLCFPSKKIHKKII